MRFRSYLYISPQILDSRTRASSTHFYSTGIAFIYNAVPLMSDHNYLARTVLVCVVWYSSTTKQNNKLTVGLHPRLNVIRVTARRAKEVYVTEVVYNIHFFFFSRVRGAWSR